jgi:hypothetical protein
VDGAVIDTQAMNEAWRARGFEPAGNGLSAGLGLSNGRLLLGYERGFAADRLGLGLRLGYAFGESPDALSGGGFFPFHAEARLLLRIGKNPGSGGFHPYAVLSAGAAEFAASESVTLYPTPSHFEDENYTTAIAWKRAGMGFVAAGWGVEWSLSEHLALTSELKGTMLVGSAGIAVSLFSGVETRL